MQRNFYSLGPTKINQFDNELTGQVVNQHIMLRTSNEHPPTLIVLGDDYTREMYGIPSPNKNRRLIIYFKSPSEAKTFLQKF